MKIGLIGTRFSGKTCFFGGLYYKYSNGRSPFPPLAANERFHTVTSFWIYRVPHATDRSLLDSIKTCFSAVPISEFPPPTRFADFYPIDIEFRTLNLREGGTWRKDERLEIVDVPGQHLDPNYNDRTAVQKTESLVTSCDAFIVFIDPSTLAQNPWSYYEGLIDNFGKFMIRAVEKGIYSRGLMPVTLVISKWDCVNPVNAKAMSDEIFSDLALRLSRISDQFLVMSCPISIVEPKRRGFQAMNIQFPFLFSALGIIYGRFLSGMDDARGVKAARSNGFWKGLAHFLFEDTRFVGSIMKDADQHKRLARSIFGHLCLEAQAPGNLLRFAQSGEETNLALIPLDI